MRRGAHKHLGFVAGLLLWTVPGTAQTQPPLRLLRDLETYEPPFSSNPRQLVRFGDCVYCLVDRPDGWAIGQIGIQPPHHARLLLETSEGAERPTLLGAGPDGILLRFDSGPSLGLYSLRADGAVDLLPGELPNLVQTVGVHTLLYGPGAEGARLERLRPDGTRVLLAALPGADPLPLRHRNVTRLGRVDRPHALVLVVQEGPGYALLRSDGTVAGTERNVLPRSSFGHEILGSGDLGWVGLEDNVVRRLSFDAEEPYAVGQPLEQVGGLVDPGTDALWWCALEPSEGVFRWFTDRSTRGAFVFEGFLLPLGPLGPFTVLGSSWPLRLWDPRAGTLSPWRQSSFNASELIGGSSRWSLALGHRLLWRNPVAIGVLGLDPQDDWTIAVGGDGAANEVLSVGLRVFFPLHEEPVGVELWATDTTSAGTRCVADLSPERLPFNWGSNPRDFASTSRASYFVATTREKGGARLWRTDGSAALTQVEELPAGYRNPRRLTRCGDGVIFLVDGPDGARSLLRLGSMGGIDILPHPSLDEKVQLIPGPEVPMLFDPATQTLWGLASGAPELLWEKPVQEPDFVRLPWVYWGDQFVFALRSQVLFTDGTLAGSDLQFWTPSPMFDVEVLGDSIYVLQRDKRVMRWDPDLGTLEQIATGVTHGLRLAGDRLYAFRFAAYSSIDVNGVPAGGALPNPQATATVPLGERLLWFASAGLYSVGEGDAVPLIPEAEGRVHTILTASESEAWVGIGEGLWITDGTAAGTRRVDDLSFRPSLRIDGPDRGLLYLMNHVPEIGAEPFVVAPGPTVEDLGLPCARRGAARLRVREGGPSDSLRLALRSPRNATALLLLSPETDRIPLGGLCGLHVDLGGAQVLGPYALQQGELVVDLPIPALRAAFGETFHAQVVLGPSDHPLGVDLSQGLRMQLGAEQQSGSR